MCAGRGASAASPPCRCCASCISRRSRDWWIEPIQVPIGTWTTAAFASASPPSSPWFPLFFQRGIDGSAVAAAVFLPRIRGDGMACERAMFDRHRRREHAQGQRVLVRPVVRGCRACCTGAATVLEREAVVRRSRPHLRRSRRARTRAPRRWRAPPVSGSIAQHGLTGARGEAQSGFATARKHGVAPYVRARAAGDDDERALHEALLQLMAHNRDTNLVSRGGMDRALRSCRPKPHGCWTMPCTPTAVRIAQLAAFDRVLIARNLSPGGSADLLAVSWFLAHLRRHRLATDAWFLSR